jgi:hypothetical protein
VRTTQKGSKTKVTNNKFDQTYHTESQAKKRAVRFILLKLVHNNAPLIFQRDFILKLNKVE